MLWRLTSLMVVVAACRISSPALNVEFACETDGDCTADQRCIGAVCKATAADAAPGAPLVAWHLVDPASGHISRVELPTVSARVVESGSVTLHAGGDSSCATPLSAPTEVVAGVDVATFQLAAPLTGDGLKSFWYRFESSARTVCASTDLSYMLDTRAPTITSVQVRHSAASHPTAAVPFRVTADEPIRWGRCADSLTRAEERPWVPLRDGVVPCIAPYRSATGVSFWLWVRDAAGNTSEPMAATADIDLSKWPSLSMGTQGGGVALQEGSIIRLDFTARAPLGFDGSLRVSSTLDHGATEEPLTTLTNGANVGCEVDVAKGRTGCAVVHIPAGLTKQPFQLILRFVDAAGTPAAAASPILNAPGVRLFAGVDVVRDTAARGASLSDAIGRMAVDPWGAVYFTGVARLYRIDGFTGALTTVVGDGVYGSSPDGVPAKRGRVYTTGGAVGVDPHGRVYWFDGDVRRLGDDGSIETFVGGGSGGLVPCAGCDRRAFAFRAGAVNYLDFDSEGRLLMGYVHWSTLGGAVLRVGHDDTIEFLAGDLSASTPVVGSDARGTGLGANFHEGVGMSFAVRHGSPDTLFMMLADNNIYTVDLDTLTLRFFATWGTNTQQMTFNHHNDTLVVNYPGGASIYAADGGLLEQRFGLTGGYFNGVTSDVAGNLYATDNLGLTVMASTAEGPTFESLAGAAAADPTPRPAAEVPLHKPRGVVVLTSHDVLIEEPGGDSLLRIDGDGTLSWERRIGAVRDPIFGHFAATAGGTKAVYVNWYWVNQIVDPRSGTCVWTCGTGAPLYDVTDGSLAADASPTAFYGLAYDAARDSNFVWSVGPTFSTPQEFSVIQEIDNQGRVFGRINTARTVVGVPSGPVEATPLPPRPLRDFPVLQAWNGTVYAAAEGPVYRLPLTGSAGVEVDWVSSFLVDGPNQTLYYTVASELYAKTLGATGPGRLLTTLPFSAPSLQAKGTTPHSVLVSTGDQIFMFVDPRIP